MPARPDLDDDELVLLAVKAIRANDTVKAVGHLRRVLERSPRNGKAHHLLAGIHASAGSFDLALQGMRRAVELEPGLHGARFQLGLLHFTFGRLREAEEAWQPLEALGDGDALYLFQRGLRHLGRDEFEACLLDLRAGMAVNTDHPHLNGDMAKVIERVEAILPPSAE